ncbi:MAG: hypothetical protein HQK51_05010 [Oligoflexia bacterium]|nr:hypothetical protein [Oligoflexia bacterium]
MNKKNISDITIEILQSIYLKAIILVLSILLALSLVLWLMLIRPRYLNLIQKKENSKNALLKRNIDLALSYAEQSSSNINTLLRLAENAVYAISSDVLSF